MPYNYHILDEGELKYIEHYKMTSKATILHDRLHDQYYKHWWALFERVDRGDRVCVEELNKLTTPHNMTNKMLEEYYNQQPFQSCWMLNISPNWKQEEKLLSNRAKTAKMVQFLREVIGLFYDDAKRFTKCKCVLEGGKEANFLHAHCVFELNKNKPNNISHMKKGNFLKSFRTIWDRHCQELKYKDWEGLVGSKYALQTTYITSEEMLKDKLDYLIEENKPLSHQNHEDFKSIKMNWDWD